MQEYFLYMTVNLVNYKKYIGLTKKPISSGYIGSGTHFQRAVRKYGKCFFVRHDLAIGTLEEISNLEKSTIAYYDATRSSHFYNRHTGGYDGPHGELTKFQISEAIKLKWKDPAYSTKVRKSFLTRDPTKLRAAIKCRDLSGARNGMFGKHHTDDAKLSMSTKKRGIKMNLSEEQKTNRSAAITGEQNPNFGGISDKRKAAVRWGALRRTLSKTPVISDDMRMMHNFYGISEKAKALSPQHSLEHLNFRFRFLAEELAEGVKAIKEKNADDVVDSLVDLIVVAMGTLDLYDVDFKKAWYAVLTANMQKEVGIKASRPNPLGLPDLIKPAGWVSPQHADNVGLLAKVFAAE